MTAAAWQSSYRSGLSKIDRAQMQLRAAGYTLRHGDDGGWWLRGQYGIQWFETWEAAYDALANGTALVARLGRK